MVVLVLEIKNVVCFHLQNPIILLFLMWFEKKKLFVFKENTSTFGLHFKFMLHVANFLNMPSYIII
jgi:hypothetical protein